MLIQSFSKRMLVDWPNCGSDPQDEGHLACLNSLRCQSRSGRFIIYALMVKRLASTEHVATRAIWLPQLEHT